MLIIQQILKKYNIPFSVLGGATNRIALYIDGYAVKFAVDHQGYVDNLIEYSISYELQPYVTKAYETNGYILVAETVKTMSLDDFKLRRTDIETILSNLSQDYLLGDVGIANKNYTNWGIRDNGEAVILDYAYVHRGTEKLFTCEVCGCGILRYDSTYTKLKCSNVSNCNAEFNYIQRKAVQGDQVDLDMIEECKNNSIKLGKGISEKELFENQDGSYTGRRVITTLSEYIKYLKENNNMLNREFDTERAMDLLVKQALATSEAEKKKIGNELDELYQETNTEEEVDIEIDELHPVYNCDDGIDVIEEGSNDETAEEDEEPVYEAEDSDYVHAFSIDDLVAMARQGNDVTEPVVQETVVETETVVVTDEVDSEPVEVDEPVSTEDDVDTIEVNYAPGVFLNGEKI